MTLPATICHDQEPLDYNQYTDQDIKNLADGATERGFYINQTPFSIIKQLFDQMHIRVTCIEHCYDKTYLLHSEQCSDQIALYQKHNFLPIYVWSHGLIAREWFRYAEHDPVLSSDVDQIKYDFLIYNRAWSGTREYRLKFIELLVDTNLHLACLTSFSQHDTEIHYTDHQYKNSKFKINTTDLELRLKENCHDSNASADYNNQDYATTGIEIVLETLFDDSRWHLTEKALRPIACGHPFILAATPGSLQYLRNYGFETFAGLIDETYDTITDPLDRINAIVKEMQRIAGLDSINKKILWQQLRAIAKRNKERFFSAEFHQQIVDEYKENFYAVQDEMNQSYSNKIINLGWEFGYQAAKYNPEFCRHNWDEYVEKERFTNSLFPKSS
jgi:hypothetical protein